MTHNSVLAYLLSAVIADIDEVGLLHIVQGTLFDAATDIVLFKRHRDLDSAAMGLASAFGWLSYQHADGFFFTGVSCLRFKLRVERSSIDVFRTGQACRR